MRELRRICFVLVLVVVGLGAGTAPTYADATVTVSGVVLGTDGQPAAGATIELIKDPDADGCPEVDHGQHPVVLATTDADGRFSFTCTAGFIWVNARLATGEYSVRRTFASGVHDDVVFRVYATKGSIEGTVYDQYGVPAPDAHMLFIWDQPGAGAYDYFDADANGRYRVDRLNPGVGYVIVAWIDDEEVQHHFTAIEGAITHDFVIRRDEPDLPPGGAFTGASGSGRLKVNGWAHDDIAVTKVAVAIRNRATGRWLRLNGSWGAYQRHPVELTAPGARRTGWWLQKRLRPGRYGVSLVVRDGAGHRNPAPRPWRSVTVRR